MEIGKLGKVDRIDLLVIIIRAWLHILQSTAPAEVGCHLLAFGKHYYCMLVKLQVYRHGPLN